MNETKEIKFECLEPAGEKIFWLNISHHHAFYNEDNKGKKMNLYCLSNYENGPNGEFFELVDLPDEDNKNINAKIFREFISGYQAFVVQLENLSSAEPGDIKEKFNPPHFAVLPGNNYLCQLKGAKMVAELCLGFRDYASCILVVKKENALGESLRQNRLIEWLAGKNVEPVILANLHRISPSSLGRQYNFKALLTLAENCEAVVFFPDDFEGEMLAVLSRRRLGKKLLGSINKFRNGFPLRRSTKKQDVVYLLSPEEIKRRKQAFKKMAEKKQEGLA